jgi:hypothetical protein
VAIAALLVGCTTIHALGPIEDPSARAQLSARAGEGGALVGLRSDPATNGLPWRHRVSGVTPSGLLIAPAGEQPATVVPLSQVASVSRYDRRRGAAEGALAGGIAGFVSGFAVGTFVTDSGSHCADDCPPRPNALAVGLRAGGLLGLFAAVVGAALGALAGHEERFVFTPQ